MWVIKRIFSAYVSGWVRVSETSSQLFVVLIYRLYSIMWTTRMGPLHVAAHNKVYECVKQTYLRRMGVAREGMDSTLGAITLWRRSWELTRVGPRALSRGQTVTRVQATCNIPTVPRRVCRFDSVEKKKTDRKKTKMLTLIVIRELKCAYRWSG